MNCLDTDRWSNCQCSCHTSVEIAPKCWRTCNKYYIQQNGMTSSGINYNEQIKSLEDKITHLGNYLKSKVNKLEKRIDDVEKLFYDELHIIKESNVKPYKCPVCDGDGGFYISGVMDSECKVCKGKGIIWG